MKFSTFYFSGTGNTEWAVREFNRIIVECGHDVDSISIDGIDAQKPSFLVEIFFLMENMLTQTYMIGIGGLMLLKISVYY
ncbi:hypothetical protein [Clostridium sp. BNL1100]|uniref:hypothetical protein n=1 Tax=Clostridium sp. BNL1100 TaxID=755731 RepID=UPI00024A7812|nr:hypothetical protein [Clostridium sp. BNL1100]AEY66092.1 hypothetical protein Clo1100_1888 [Clostridium sp. BNL1100]